MPIESQMALVDATAQITAIVIVCGLIAASAYSTWRLRLAMKRGAESGPVAKWLAVLVGSLLLGFRALMNLL